MSHLISTSMALLAGRTLGRRMLAGIAMALALTACGGGSGASESKLKTNGAADTTVATAGPDALIRKGAALNSRELAAAQDAAEGGRSPTKALTKRQAKGLSKVPVYRFFNTRSGAHFYTSSAEERDSVIANLPQFAFEGVAFQVGDVAQSGLSPVYRFYNRLTGIHFYSISDEEKSFIEASLPQFAYEGVAYYASKVLGDGFRPLYRFYQLNKGVHFYTVDEAEKDRVRATLPQYAFENTAYYVPDDSYIAPKFKVPHTGFTGTECLNLSGALTDCSASSALDFYDQQDGHRSAVNPLSYSLLPKPGGGTYDKSECVLDNVTGLVWEGKTDSGVRSGLYRTTHLDNPALPQKWNGSDWINPTQAEVLAITNSVGYRNHVNSVGLCGYTDWRLPTVKELQSILHAGTPAGVDQDWFVNAESWSPYWAATPSVSTRSGDGWVVGGAHGALPESRSEWRSSGVRLVRSAWSVSESSCPSQPTAERFTLNGAEATDKTTGLVWARCAVGMSWDGFTCTGEPLPMTYIEALQYAKTQMGWRVPNVKELLSVVDHGCAAPALDATVFPRNPSYFTWSTTPHRSFNSTSAWSVNLSNGTSQIESPSNLRRLQLVRVNP